MISSISSLNRKEMFSGSMVLFIGLYYILVFASSLFQLKSVKIQPHEFLLELKWFLSGLLYVAGAILLFRKKYAGWIISSATILNFVVIILMNIIQLSQLGGLQAYTAITIGFFILLLMAFTFLFSRQIRKEFGVNNKSYLLTIALYLLLVTVTYWL